MGDRLATIYKGRKLGPAVSLWRRRGAGSPSNTMSPGPRSTFLRSGILIHPAVWPQQTWVEDWGLPGEGKLGPYLTQCGRGRSPPQCQVSSWSIQLFRHNTPTLQRDCRANRQDKRSLNKTTYIIKQNWNQFLLVVKATGLRQQISKFYPQILSTEASFYICDRSVTGTSVIASVCALNLRIKFWYLMI